MEELFIHLLAGIFQFVAEALLEIVGEGVLGLIGRGLSSLIDGALAENAGLISVVAGFLLFGLLCGAISLVFFPSRFFYRNGMGLVINPLAAGVVCLGCVRPAPREEQQRLRRQSFAAGFSFILGLTVIRFFLAR